MSTLGSSPEIGDLVSHRGILYVLRGLEPEWAAEPRAELEDAVTGEVRSVLVGELEPGPTFDEPAAEELPGLGFTPQLPGLE